MAKMQETGDERLRALIRLIPPARALRDDLEKSIHLELYHGTGDLAVKSFQGLHASIVKITDDPYVASLSLSVPKNATDKEKVSLARLAAGQLAAYLEGQTGLVGMGGGGNYHIQTAPIIQAIQGLSPETVDKIVDKAFKGKEEEEGQEEKPKE
jgi:hypothetical protein